MTRLTLSGCVLLLLACGARPVAQPDETASEAGSEDSSSTASEDTLAGTDTLADDPDFLVPLCPAHHRAAHVGALVVRGSFSVGLVFEHADGRRYGSKDMEPAQAHAYAQAFDAMRAMGFKEREARAYIDAARPHVGSGVQMPALLYEVLRLTPVPGVREDEVVYLACAG